MFEAGVIIVALFVLGVVIRVFKNTNYQSVTYYEDEDFPRYHPYHHSNYHENEWDDD